MQVCSGDWGGPAQANTARKTLLLPSKHQFQCLEGTKKESVLGEKMVFVGEAKAQHAPGGCRWVGRDMANISPTFGGWGLCATCGRESEVKATENKKWMVTKKKKKSGKKRGWKKKKNVTCWS